MENRTVISSWDVLVQNYTQALSLYRKAYTQAHEDRFSAYQKAEEEIRSSDEVQRVKPEKLDKLLKSWNTYLCEKLDWDETLFRCRTCGAPLSTVNFHLKLVETNTQDVLKELRSLIGEGEGPGYYPGDKTKYTSLRGCKKIGEDIYRVKRGRFRIIYHVDDEHRLIKIGKVDRRRENTYKGIEALFR